MRGLISIFAVAAAILAIVKSDQEWRLELLDPQGFRVFMKHDEGIQSVKIGGWIRKKPIADEPTDEYFANMTLGSDGWWVYQNLTAPLDPGDRNDIVIANTRAENSTVFPLDDLIIEDYVVPEDAQRVPV